MDSKNSISLAVYGIILAIFLSLDFTKIPQYLNIIIWVWFGITVVGILCSIISLVTREFDMPPKIDNLIKKYLSASDYDTKNILLSTIEVSIKKNAEVLEGKMRYLDFSLRILLPISLLFSVFFVGLRIAIGG